MFAEGDAQPDTKNVSGFSFARKTAAACLMNRVMASVPKPEPEKTPVDENRVPVADAEARLHHTTEVLDSFSTISVTQEAEKILQAMEKSEP